MDYSSVPTYRLDMGEIDEAYEGLHVDLVRSHDIPYADYQRLWTISAAQDIDDPAAIEDFTLNRIAFHIAGWNLPDYNGDPLPLPRETPDSVAAINSLRMSWQHAIAMRILAEWREANDKLGEVVRSYSPGAKSSTGSTSET